MRQVIYAWNYLEWGGAQVHILALIKEARKEFSVAVVIPRGSDPQFVSYLDELGVRVEYFDAANPMSPPAGIREKIDHRVAKAKSEYAMLRALEQFDLRDSIVHVDLLPHSSLFALTWLAMRTNVFITSHNALPQVSGVREALWKLKAATISRFPTFHVFCSNEHAKRYFSSHYSAAVSGDIKVTYTSVNPQEIDQASADKEARILLRSQVGIGEDETVVLGVGNFIDRKGRWTFLDAAKKMAESGSTENVRFVWLTPTLPPQEDIVRIEAYGLGERFRLVESAEIGGERPDILRFFRIADIFALPSFVEGLPIALLEAMATGLASISTNVYGIPEAVLHEETGILIEPGDSEALASAIGRLAADPGLRTEMGRNARRLVLDKFDERIAARTAIAAYKAALDH